VLGELQAITYNEWLPALLGSGLGAYRGYDPNVNPSISNKFATAAFRFGHSIVGTDIEFLDNAGNQVGETLSFADAFFNRAAVKVNRIDPLLMYLSRGPAQELDTKVVGELRNMLLAVPGSTVRLDLATLNIQRG
jgi:peroxidase